MASIYSKSAPCRLAWLRFTVNQPRARLHGFVEVFASSKQDCMASSKSSPASSRLVWPRRSLRQRQAGLLRFTVNQLRAGLHGPVEVFASSKQACRASSKSSPASSRLARPRRSLRQRQAGLHGLVEVFASSKQACRAPSKSSPASSRLTPIYRKSALQDFSDLVEGADGELWAEVARER